MALSGPEAAHGAASDAAAVVPIFFPPVPPPLGAPRPAEVRAAPDARPAPPELSAYVTEPFYAPLSTRFARSEVGDELDFRLEMYRQTRSALLAELQARLEMVRELGVAERERALRTFSREQTPRIAGLEREAESLREYLSRHRSGGAEYRRWMRSLAVSRPNPTPALRLQLVRSAEFYWSNFSGPQRRLLSGIAIRLAEELAPPHPAPEVNSGPVLYFSPETARIRLPAHLPPNLAEKIAAYSRERTALEDELIKAMCSPRGFASETARSVALQALAKTQDPRLAALENSAEDIRRELAGLSDPARPPDLPSLTPELAARIAAYHKEKLALNKELLACRNRVIASDPNAGDSALNEKIRQAIAGFSNRNSDRYAALNRNRDSIRGELAKLPSADTGSPDSLPRAFSESLRRLQTFWVYRDYQTAVLQPGLSPEERRLLFENAVEKLELPLPAGELRIASP